MIETTVRGFDRIDFRDGNFEPCSLQCSSAMNAGARDDDDYPMLWLGVNDAKPQIMASKAEANGVPRTQPNGWQPFHVPGDVLMTTRMHLARKQVPELIERLQRWYDTGSLRTT